MTTSNRAITFGSGRAAGAPRLRRAAAAALMGLSLAACSSDDILDVDDPDVALPESLAGATALPTLLAGARGEFGVAYSGGADLNAVTLAGLLSDELINTETFPTRIEIDARRQQPENNTTLRDLFYDMGQARAAADLAVDAFAEFDSTAIGYVESLNLSGLTYVLFAENYCGAIPISRETEPGKFEFGVPLTTVQLLDTAIAKFTRARDLAGTAVAGRQPQRQLAQVGLGRALLNKGDFAAAAAAVNGVPTTFVYQYQHSETTARQNNSVWALTASVGRFGVADREGGNGLPFRTEGDTAGRTATNPFDRRVINHRRPTATGRGFDNATIQYVQLKYPLRASAAIIANGVEARLIEAEAALRSGNVTGAFTILNTLRTTSPGSPGLTALTPAATTAGQVDQLFKERAYWLFLTSHRLGDLRRLIRQYGRPAETVFPTGGYFKGGSYGTDVNSPVPQAEENNPNFKREMCKQNEA